MTTLPARRARHARLAATLVVAALFGAACGKVRTGDAGAGPIPHADAGPDSTAGGASGGAPGSGGGLVGAAGLVGAGGVATSSREAGPPPDSCVDVTGTLPTDCVEPLCACLPSLVRGCGVKCWVDVACIRQRCAGKSDPSCADGCGDPGVGTREAVRQCVVGLPACSTPGRCGDGVLTPPETCDGTNLLGRTCQDLGFKGGDLRCSPSCVLDTSGCTNCGNGITEIGEDCEGAPQDATCVALGYAGGELGCDPKCHFDTSACTSCGNGRLDEGEDCDGDLLATGVTCRSYGFSGGRPGCKSCAVDTRPCAACGNGVIEPGETCDGSALGGATCATLGFASGTLACDEENCRLDVGGCTGATPRCGDGIAERSEECDGKDLTGLDCKAFGFDQGTLTCNAATCRFDATGCVLQAHDACKECLALKCKYQLDKCTADARCTEGLHCLQTCAGPNLLPGQLNACSNLCFADDFNGNLPPDREQAVALVMLVFGCSSSKCTASCVGPLP